jgi:1-aminocyclopropane-1-carboxylate deaminase/D-cysteine desulfhydrase-like pyridoxal-dependent ACC family enzyme
VTAPTELRDALAAIPSIPLAPYPTPIEEMTRLRAALGGGPRLFVKRDDTIPFAFGGNKVRKMRIVLAQAREVGADTLITSGGIQSNHCRVTAAAAARQGLRCVIVANGTAPAKPTANALLDALFGAEVRYVARREDRAPMVDNVADELRSQGRRPFVVPLGASTPHGAAAFALAVGELAGQMKSDRTIPAPDVIVHSTSSGGTQAGLIAGCRIYSVPARILGISADETSAALGAEVRKILAGLERLVGAPPGALASDLTPEIDDGFVGDGYGIPTPASRGALELLARTEAIVLDPTYTAKAMAGLIAHVRGGRFKDDQAVMFWHTGGQVGVFV